MTRPQISVLVTVLIGAVVLSFMLRAEPDSTRFYLLTLGLAAVWAVGARAAGHVSMGRLRHITGPIVLGLVLVLVFVLGGLVVRQIEPLDTAVRNVVALTGDGTGPLLLFVTVVTGVCEELFFRGALFDVVPRYPVLVTTVVYAVATAATGNVMLAFAALLLGVVTGLQREATGGVLAPALTHVTWSGSMLFVLPLLFPAV